MARVLAAFAAVLLLIVAANACTMSCSEMRCLVGRFFPDHVIDTMFCIAHYESRWQPCARGSDGVSEGLFQINYRVWLGQGPCPNTFDGLFNAEANARCARHVYDTQGLTAWATYRFCDGGSPWPVSGGPSCGLCPNGYCCNGDCCNNGCLGTGNCNVPGDNRCVRGECTSAGNCREITGNWGCDGEGPRKCTKKCCRSRDCVNDCTWDGDPRCPATAHPDWMPVRDRPCNFWTCQNGDCNYVCRPGADCTDYNLPGAPTKDWQCWDPRCECQGSGRAQCRGVPTPVQPESCPLPVGPAGTVDAACYSWAQKCTGDGYCRKDWIQSDGNVCGFTVPCHLGTCPVPAQYNERCAWPYCDRNGKCQVDVLSGQLEPYNPGNRPDKPACELPAQYNADCYRPFCQNGVCGGAPYRFNLTCTPDPDEVDQVHNPQCVYYTCGYKDGEWGKCISRVYPNGRFQPCQDDELCSWDWCLDGQCAEHEWKRCGTHEGVCVITGCDPATGNCITPTRNGDNCCPNGEINTGEDCEPGMNGADEQCCQHCNHVTGACDDKNECTTEQCQSGRCVSTFADKVCDEQNPEDVCSHFICVPDAETVGKCARVPNPDQDQQVCAPKPSNCTKSICINGECVVTADEEFLGKECTDPEGGVQPHVCSRYLCQEVEGNTAACLLVADAALSCDDEDLCTTERCALDETGKGYCQYNVSVKTCDNPEEELPICHTPRVCIPETGECSDFIPVDLPEVGEPVPCVPPTPAMRKREVFDTCTDYICVKGECLRNCPCGNGVLEEGEECDFGLPHQAACCNNDCTGCACGNGVLDEGEECDFNIPEQTGCCNATCQGCYCGNGILEEGEECDPAMPEFTDCCNSTCQGCLVVAAASGATAEVIPGVVAAGAVLALAAVAFLVAKAAAGGPAGAGASPVVDGAGGFGADNPLFQPLMAESTNPLYVGN